MCHASLHMWRVIWFCEPADSTTNQVLHTAATWQCMQPWCVHACTTLTKLPYMCAIHVCHTFSVNILQAVSLRIRCECGEQELCERAGNPMPPTPYKSLQHTRFRAFQGTCPCHVLHPGRTCNAFMLNFFPGAYLRSAPHLPICPTLVTDFAWFVGLYNC